MAARLGSGSEQWNGHRVLCWVVNCMVGLDVEPWSEQTCSCVIYYLAEIIQHCDDMEMVKWIILSLESWWLNMKLHSVTKSQLLNALRSRTTYLSQVNITSEHVDVCRYQVGWCAQWFIDNVGLKSQIPLIKLSSDRCGARNDSKNFYSNVPVRSAFAVTSGVHYYEVIPLTTDGGMRFGWSTMNAKFSDRKVLGKNEESIGFEIEDECHIFHQGKHSRITNHSAARESINVIGCLIDVDNRQFVFYLNGEKIEWQGEIHFSSLPYYATATLQTGQHCQLNFGQTDFKYAPKDDKRLKETPFHITQRYQLTETFEYTNWYWFCHPLISDSVDLFYSDPKQIEYDEFVRQLEHDKSTLLNETNVELGRLIQSVIELVDRKLKSDRTDMATMWVRKMIELTKFKKDWGFEKVKLLELFYPYLQLSISSINSTKRYNTCLIMILLYNFNNSFIEFIEHVDILLSQTIGTFINSRMFINDPLIIVYTLNYLKHPQLRLTTQALLNDPSIMSTLNWCSELFGHVSSVSRLYEPNCDLVRLQVGMCARWCHLIRVEEQYFSSQSTLNPEDKSKPIKLSSDCLSARNDDAQTSIVRSVCSVSSNTFYYEAVLLTDGAMRFGWATKQTNLDEFAIGSNEHSIGFNASEIIFQIHHKTKNFVDNPRMSDPPFGPLWSFGDVVGCLINCDKKIFQFFLNGKLIKCKEFVIEYGNHGYPLHFSDEPYYAAITVERHQQCYLNLGQSPFRHPPSVPFSTFHQVSPTPPPTPLYSPRFSSCYSLVNVLAKERVKLLFDDSRQKIIDSFVDKFVKNISNDTIYLELELEALKDDVDRLRMLQSLIEVDETKLRIDDHQLELNVQANFIAHLIAHSTSANPAFADLVAQLLYPYFTLHFASNTINTHRNVCIVVASMVTVMDSNFKARTNLYQQVFTYLNQLLEKCNQTNDEWMVLYALVAIGNLKMHQNEVKAMKSNATFCTIIDNRLNLDLNDPGTFAFNPNLKLLRQSVFISQWLSRNILNQSPTIDASSPNTKLQTLNPNHSGPHLKLSLDLLSARSDFGHFQSVRSMSCVDSKRHYYEVTLVTSGQMRFGWASENTDLTSGKLGDDQYSIGFDGHNRCVWHGGKAYKIKNIQPWNSGDVIGCAVLAIEKTFQFYLNGEQVNFTSFFDKPHYSSVQSYYAAASLTTFQQCRFAFETLQYPAKRTSFLFLRRASATISRSINIVGSVITSSIINTGSIEAGNINMRHNNSRPTLNIPTRESAPSVTISFFNELDEDNLERQNH